MSFNEDATLSAALDKVILEFEKQCESKEPTPDELFHYTNADGLLGITKSKQIWLSNARYLNDASEAQYAVDLIKQCIQLRIGESHNAADTHFWTYLSDIFPSLFDDFAPYIACFCADGDLLSQWRAYGQNGAGYSIGMKLHGIESIDKGITLLSKVIYSEREQRELVSNFLSIFHDALKRDGRWDQKHPNIVGTAAKKLAITFCKFVFRFKHPGFEEEREWRLIAIPDAGKGMIRFRPAGRWIVPYGVVDLKANLPTSKPLSPLSSVVVGPTNHPKLSRESVELLLRERDLPSVKVANSAVPFRL